MANYCCAAKQLCGMKTVPIVEVVHRCVNCADPLHGGLCGKLTAELGKSVNINPQCLTEHGMRNFSSVGGLICNFCIKSLDGAQPKSPAGVLPSLPPLPAEVATGIIDVDVAAAAAPKRKSVELMHPRNKPPKKKRDEQLYSHFTITNLPGGGVSVTCNHCSFFNKAHLKSFNATVGRRHLTIECPGIDGDIKRRLQQGSQAGRRAGALYAQSRDPTESVAEMRESALMSPLTQASSRSSTSASSSGTIDLTGGAPSMASSVRNSRRNNLPQATLSSSSMFGPPMTKAIAEKIIVAEVKAILARRETPDRLLDDHVRAALATRHSALPNFVPHNAQTIYDNYVVPIDRASLLEMETFIGRLPGMINIAMDGATVNGKSKVSISCHLNIYWSSTNIHTPSSRSSSLFPRETSPSSST